jgi:hypothetical protein
MVRNLLVALGAVAVFVLLLEAADVINIFN